MFDINRTIKLITGALLDREATWREYLPEADNWQKTAFLLTGPLIIASAILAYVFGLFASDGSMFSMFRPTILSTIGQIIIGAMSAGAFAFILAAFAGTFGGKNSFALGLAAMTLAFVPAYIGQALVWLPWIGGLLAFGLGIFSLIQLWKIIPIYLEVPDSKRTMHYVVSFISIIIAMAILSRIFAPLIPGPSMDDAFGPTGASNSSSEGMFGNMQRQAAIVAEAEEDAYSPPSDGKLTDRQVQNYASTMATVAGTRAESMKRMEALAEEAEKDESVSVKDIGTMMAGMSEFSSLGTIEMETVKAEGMNWAEHMWVKETLWTARMQQQGSEALEHNFTLFEKYADQLNIEVSY